MSNRIKKTSLLLGFALTVFGVFNFANTAQAIAINKCIRVIHNPQVSRETLVNTCSKCITAKIKRRRPGSATGTPTQREFNLQPGSHLLLPFKGPGQTRITSELPCPFGR